MKDLYVDHENHLYYYKGELKPCVSDILKIVDSIAMEGIPRANIDKAAERGKKVHEITEDYECGLIDILDDEWIQENEQYINYLYAYINFMREHKEIPIAIEESLYSEKYDYAGTLDLVKYMDGTLYILDKKTSKTISELRNTLQLNAYRLMWNEVYPHLQVEGLKVIQLSNNGEHRLIDIPVDEELFLTYLNIFKQIKGDKKL